MVNWMSYWRIGIKKRGRENGGNGERIKERRWREEQGTEERVRMGNGEKVVAK